MYLSILILPLLGSFISGILGRKIGPSGSHLITIILLCTASVLSVVAFYEVGLNQSSVTITLCTWLSYQNTVINWSFLFDPLTSSMLICVLPISTLVHLYSIDYMGNDPHNQRFFSYLSLFTFFMLILVSADNYFVMFVGWEGIGVCSYLLINFWYTRIQANKASILALTMNRVGDMGLSIGFFILLQIASTVDYSTLLPISYLLNNDCILLVSLLFLSGALAKSAQIPLHSWLPGSMEGPTPVSALIHAATLVTAGLYLLLRSSPFIEYSSTALLWISVIGASTAFFGSLCALCMNDLKRVIAFSTISQLGYMVLSVGLSQYNLGIFHVVNHAFFKALLFLGAGSIIHSVNDQQDIRKLGGLVSFLPVSYITMLIGSIALLGLPWLSGFYSKDLIIELSFSSYKINGLYGYILLTSGAACTAFYSFRLLSLVFISNANMNKASYLKVHESPFNTLLVLSILSILSIFFGYLTSDLYSGLGTDFFANVFSSPQDKVYLIDSEFAMPILLKLTPTTVSIVMLISSIVLYNTNIGMYTLNNLVSNNTLLRNIYSFLIEKGYFDVVYNKYIISRGMNYGLLLSKVLDRGVIEALGSYGIVNGLLDKSLYLKGYDDHNIQSYAIYMLLGILFLLLFTTT